MKTRRRGPSDADYHPGVVETQPQVAEAPTERRPERWALTGWVGALCATGLYLVASIVIFAGSAIAHLNTMYIPQQNASDSEFFRWALVWTPWAISHGHNPMFTNMIHAPQGTSLVWVTASPGAALVMWPVTEAFGALVSYNLIAVLSPVLAGWATYLLCRRLTGRFWPSLAAGFVFGFSAFMTSQLNHPNLSLTFPIPLAAYLTVRRVEGSLGRVVYVALLAATMLALWSISIEVFATATMFGAIAFVIALIAAGRDRRRIFALILPVAVSYAIVLAVVWFPYLLPALREAPTSLAIDPEKKHIDLFRFIVPQDRQLIGGNALVSLAARVTDPYSSAAGYLGVGLLAAVVGYAITERKHRETWALVAFFLITSVMAMGPRLYVLGRRTIPLPDVILEHLPLVQNALPGRFIAYPDLALAVMVALWLSRAHGRAIWLRWGVVSLGLLLLIPWVQSPIWRVPDVTPAFFRDGAWSQTITPGETVAIFAEKKGQDMAWQADTGMAFRLPDGYIGAIPEPDPSSFSRGVFPRGKPNAGALRRWLDAHGVTAIVVMDPVRSWFEPALRELGYAPVREGDDVSVWRTG